MFGGKLAEELYRVAAVKRYLLQLLRAGRARLVAAAAIDQEEVRVRDLELAQSNDIHVLALARASGARTLCSADQLLHRDFRNKRLISNPRGLGLPVGQPPAAAPTCRFLRAMSAP